MELHAEVAAFLTERNALLATVLNYEDCKLPISLQGKSATVFDTNAKVSSFKRKIIYSLECVVYEDIDCFSLTKSFLDGNNLKIQEKMQNNIHTHLEVLKYLFEYYFPTTQEKMIDDFGWVQTVFSEHKRPPSLNSAKLHICVRQDSPPIRLPKQNTDAARTQNQTFACNYHQLNMKSENCKRMQPQ
ncbi:hypothetical protein PR048_022156, partial [Dryococelus australis]